MTKKRKILHAIVLTLESICVLMSLFGIWVLGSLVDWDWIYLLIN